MPNQNYITIGVSVLIATFSARNNGVAARQESNPQSPTEYSSVRQTVQKLPELLIT